MRKFSVFFLLFTCLFLNSIAQTPKTYTSSEILLQLKKLNVLGSVLYIAAHPDDENTRLLAYLANEKLYRTGYLSLTRGDGGQNLIGDEQGIDLGLIRTQELLAARRIDGAEQFFSRAYDFGFCKSTEEALQTWGHDKILSDVVWVIRKFKPDVIITRFPGDSRAGHGHHSASAVLAGEAFDAAADSTKFPEQLSMGVTTWKAKRLLWNTFSFGGNNTTSEDQFKVDVGVYNPLLGKGYGEIAALSRSQHKSQGFGVPAQRGTAIEYFATTKGEKPVKDLMDDIYTNWSRVNNDTIDNIVEEINNKFSEEYPERSVPQLVNLYKAVATISDGYWKIQKQKEIQNLIEQCSGLYLEAATNTQYAVQGDSIKINITVNKRLDAAINKVNVHFKNADHLFDGLQKNANATYTLTTFIKSDEKLTQPYWLENPMTKGSFTVNDQQLIGKAENDPVSVEFIVNIAGTDFTFIKPVRYKYTDPVKGEIYQPVTITVPVSFVPQKSILVSNKGGVKTDNINATAFRNITFTNPALLSTSPAKTNSAGFNINLVDDSIKNLIKGETKLFPVSVVPGVYTVGAQEYTTAYNEQLRSINYDHIPSINYFKKASFNYELIDVKTSGHLVGYIAGAGDKVPEALEQLGYKVTLLKDADINTANLKQFDAIITGVRAYNTNEWLGNKYDVLMQYIKDGGTLLVQYNTNNGIAALNTKISPYPFTVSRNRITDEEAKVKFLLPGHAVLNYPNKITEKDFDGWIQERSIYNTIDIDSRYQRILSMKDPGEEDQDGSLIVTDYGKGRFVYTGLVFFRELPAGVPGAYRLFANLIAKRKK